MKNARKLLSLLLCAVLLLSVVPMTALRAEAAESTPQENYKMRIYCRIIDNTNPSKYGSVTCKITCRSDNGRGNSTQDFYIDHDSNVWHENENVFDSKVSSLHYMFSYGKDKSYFTEYTIPAAGYFPVSVYMSWQCKSSDSCEWKWNFKIKNLYSNATNPYTDISDTPQKKGNSASGTAYLNNSYLPTANGINAVSGDSEVWLPANGTSPYKQYTAKAYDNRGYTIASGYTFTSSSSNTTVSGSGVNYKPNVYFSQATSNYTTTVGAKNVFNNTTKTATSKTVSVYVPHTLTINPNGGSYNNSTSNSYATVYSKSGGTGYPNTVTLATPARTGYTFDGWEIISGSGTVSGSTFTAADSNTTVRAKWKANTYTVTLNRQSGTGGSDSVTATYDAAMPSATMPTRTGYTFGGYYDATSGGTQYYTNTGASARTWNKTAAATLYARWTANNYAVTLNGNGGSGGTASVTATYDAAMPSATMPSRTGYTFAGFYDTSAASGGTQYYTAAGASARTWNKASATELFARWAPRTDTAYTVEHYYMDTEGAYASTPDVTESKTGTTAATVTYADEKADRAGFTYDAEKSGESTAIAADGSTVIRLYYSRNQYTVTFLGNDGQTLKTQTGVYYGTAATAPEAPAILSVDGDTANHLIFDSWDADFSNITDDLTVNTVYAQQAHDFTDAVTDPTCTAQGYTTHTCADCGFVFSDSYTDMLEHAYAFDSFVWSEDGTTAQAKLKCADCPAETLVDAAVTGAFTEATCKADAFTVYTARYEDHTAQNTVTDEGTKLEHVYTNYVSNNDATCKADGTKTAVCDLCGEATDTVTDEGTKLEHVFTNYVPNNDATCKADGTKTAVCDLCGEATDTVTDEGTKLDHVYTNYVSNNDATCKADGTKTAVCDLCGEVTDTVADVGSKRDHVYTNYVSNNDATCKADGTKTAVCDLCGEATDTVADKGTKLGHDLGAWTVVTGATCEKDGKKTRECSRCDYVETKAIPATGHSFGDWTVTKEATCAEAGEKTRTCASCGRQETQTIAKPDHAWGEWTDAEGSTVTCTSGGTQYRECANCGEIETREITGGLGHHIEHRNLRGEGFCEACGEFICNRCEDIELFEDLEIVGVFYRIVHFFIHLAHMISYIT